MSDSKKLFQLLKEFSVLNKSALIESIQQQSSELLVFSLKLTSCFVSPRESLSSLGETFSSSIKTLFEELGSLVIIQFESLTSNTISATRIMTNMHQQSDSDFRLCEEFTDQKDQLTSH